MIHRAFGTSAWGDRIVPTETALRGVFMVGAAIAFLMSVFLAEKGGDVLITVFGIGGGAALIVKMPKLVKNHGGALGRFFGFGSFEEN